MDTFVRFRGPSLDVSLGKWIIESRRDKAFEKESATDVVHLLSRLVVVEMRYWNALLRNVYIACHIGSGKLQFYPETLSVTSDRVALRGVQGARSFSLHVVTLRENFRGLSLFLPSLPISLAKSAVM